MNMRTAGTASADRVIPSQSLGGTGSITINSTSDNMARYVSSIGGTDATPYTIRHSGAWWMPSDMERPVPSVHGPLAYEDDDADNPTSVKDAKRLIAEHEAAIERLRGYIEEQRRELEEGE